MVYYHCATVHSDTILVLLSRLRGTIIEGYRWQAQATRISESDVKRTSLLVQGRDIGCIR